jgi:hypothetical protein
MEGPKFEEYDPTSAIHLWARILLDVNLARNDSKSTSAKILPKREKC